MIGRIHSIETFGTVDGPGIRFVLFMQGCALQCGYCHNPDTWDTSTGRKVTVEEILDEMEPYISYYKKSGGGITVTGGEPSLQAVFVAELFRECKKRFGLNTALDSSGFCEVGHEHVREMFEETDLVLLDLKMMDRDRHIRLTSQPNDRILRTARWLSDHGRPMWVRRVIVPGLTDTEDELVRLGSFIGSLDHVEKFELLPYHSMALYKWDLLQREYPLKDARTPTDEEMQAARQIVDRARQEAAARNGVYKN
ncbi:pyruvate formate-lyase-activating protein [Paenibacillus sp. FJAT-26967]|uniref:pyruvate formate-lyase-activating protein n=1 Tax=Paenibacillus sp. FJAT-26967 TaxID=1729690 RepID=UPI0008392155|nr:pyruvate formate-lyase-activating protein [Paenibacillus sp. FJAT-26967]